MTTETPTSRIARATAPSELGASESEHRDTVNLDALDLEGLKRVAELDLSKPPFTEDGVGWRLMRAEAAYAEEYVLSTEGADHEPTEFERELLTDYWDGLISDERFFGIIRGLAARALTAEAALQSTQAELTRVREALTFYRDEWRWYPVGDEGDGVTDPGCLTGYEAEPTQALADDGGAKARAALAAQPQEEGR